MIFTTTAVMSKSGKTHGVHIRFGMYSGLVKHLLVPPWLYKSIQFTVDYHVWTIMRPLVGFCIHYRVFSLAVTTLTVVAYKASRYARLFSPVVVMEYLTFKWSLPITMLVHD